MLAISPEPEIVITKPDNAEEIITKRREEFDGSNNNSEEYNNQSSVLVKQKSSVLALTLDEIQFKSGRSFGSMNMEDFIANIWSVDQDHEVDTSPVRLQRNDGDDESKIMSSRGSNSVWREGSFSIPVPLCKKTVDEIWIDLHKETTQRQREGEENERDNNDEEEREELRRQQTLGEMTLEDFLLKAGVVHQLQSIDSNTSNSNSAVINTSSVYGLIDQHHDHQHHDYHHHHHVVGGGESSGQKGGKRRIINGPPEVLVERRQRRMIKNRESAARSRARKQAYTVELEVEFNQLKEENDKLKQVLAESELKRRQELLMKRKQCTTRAQKLAKNLRKLRRSASLTW